MLTGSYTVKFSLDDVKNFKISSCVRYCPNSSTKYDVISCLSEIIAKDTIHDQKHSLPRPCREQVRAQLYQQRENIDYNPKLKNICSKDIKTFCANVTPGSGQVRLNILINIETNSSIRYLISGP